MTVRVVSMSDAEVAGAGQPTEAGLGTLQTERGNLPLWSVSATVGITGLVSRTELVQGYHNPYDVPLEATYIFPLPDRAAVTAMRMTIGDREVVATLRERGAARAEYDRAIATGQQAAIAEQERPDVFTMRVGNIPPGERVSVALTLVGPLSYEDGEATFRLPLVVAPRYIPGTATGSTVGSGYGEDTDAVPDASRITPPVLLPGFPNPVRLAIAVDIDPGGLPLGDVRSSLHAITTEGNRLRIEPGERANRDFILRLSYGEPDTATHSLLLTGEDEGGEGTYRLTILPPTSAAPARPRDVVLVLDRSGSMQGWKMVAARRAAARIVDTLTGTDRFAVLAFDDRVDHPTTLGPGLHAATDRHRFRAVEFLATVDARGGTELLAPLTTGLGMLTDATRDRVLVLVTDGQVGNEDQILASTGQALSGVRVHTVGIDQAVNAGFLGRLAAAGGGRCELVESEDRLDTAMDHIHRRIGAPVVSGLSLAPEGLSLVDGTMSPSRLPDLFPGAPLVVTGRYRPSSGSLRVAGRTRDGSPWSASVPAVVGPDSSLTAVWARSYLRDLEDRFAGSWSPDEALTAQITAASLRFGVLCRFTAWVAVDERIVVKDGQPHRVTQPVESPAGWEMLAPPVPPPAPMMMMAAFSPSPGGARPLGFAAPAARAAAPKLSGGYHALSYRSDGFAAAPQVEGSYQADEVSVSGVPAGVRRLAGEEAARLRAAASAPAYEKRELLADLGTRLDVLARELLDSNRRDELRRLIAELDEERLLGLPADGLAALWDRTLALLDALAFA